MQAVNKGKWREEDSLQKSQFDELHSYITAFDELGLPWHWDAAAYAGFIDGGVDASTRLRRYIAIHHPHLLKAYDVDFLVAAVESKRSQVAARMSLASSARQQTDIRQAN